MTGQLYGGLPSNISNPASISIASSTATNPIVVNTSSPHGLTTGDWVDIDAHLVNTPANCVNTPVTVLTSTTFSIPIDGTAYSNGGATGSVFPLAYTGNIATLPADGDPYAATTYLPGYTAALDRSSFERASSGPYKLILDDVVRAAVTGAGTVWAGATLSGSSYSPLLVSGSPVTFGRSHVHVNDIVEIRLDTTLQITETAPFMGAFALAYAFVTYGNAGSASYAVGPNKLVNSSATGVTTVNAPATLVCRVGGPSGLTPPISYTGANNTVGELLCQVWASPFANTSMVMNVLGDYVVTCRHWRPTGIQV